MCMHTMQHQLKFKRAFTLWTQETPVLQTQARKSNTKGRRHTSFSSVLFEVRLWGLECVGTFLLLLCGHLGAERG